jgi:hypothetical protein
LASDEPLEKDSSPETRDLRPWIDSDATLGTCYSHDGLFWSARFSRAGEHQMSRAINLNAPEAHVIELCAKRNAAISAIETLRSGGTRVVFKNADDAAIIAKVYGAKVLTGPVVRMPTRLLRN